MTYKLPKNKYKARSVTACENCGAVNVPLFTEIDGSGAAYSFYNKCYCRDCCVSILKKDPLEKVFNGKCEICKAFKSFNNVSLIDFKNKRYYACRICKSKLEETKQ